MTITRLHSRSSSTAARHGHSPAAHHPPNGHEPEQERRSWAVLAVALAAQVLVVLDISVVNTALPSIGEALTLTSGDLQWLVTVYLMMSGGALLLGGRVADLVSRRRAFLSGLAVFTGASLWSALATSGGELIAARGAQGLSAAIMTPAALSLITTTYSGSQRQRGLALWGLVGSLGIAAGVLLGGALTTWAGWQSIFWINVPVGVVAFMLARRAVPSNEPTGTRLAQFDLPGAVTSLGGLMCVMFALGGTTTHGWGSMRTMLSFGAAAVLLAAFLAIEKRSARPLVPPHTWKVKTLVSGTTVMLGITGLLVGAVFLTSIFLQGVLGLSAIEAGLAFLPFALTVTIGTHLARHMLAHLAPRAIAALGALGAAGAAGLLSLASADAHYASDLLPGLLLLGLGIGMVFVPVSITAMAGIPPQHAGMASGFLMTGHEVGAALGVAVLSAIATTAGSLTTAPGIVDAFSRGFLGAGAIAVGVAVIAFLRMPAARIDAAEGGMHMHH